MDPTPFFDERRFLTIAGYGFVLLAGSFCASLSAPMECIMHFAENHDGSDAL
jgi:hypothetical protein